jgi:hypothetical protein
MTPDESITPKGLAWAAEPGHVLVRNTETGALGHCWSGQPIPCDWEPIAAVPASPAETALSLERAALSHPGRVELQNGPQEPRKHTPDVITPTGRTITVQRCCSACGEPIGDVNDAELEAGIRGDPLPDTAAEHGCQTKPPLLNPDCRAGKHQACSGTAWDDTTDALAPCGCACHDEGTTP